MPKRAHKPLVWLPACHRNLDLDDPGGYSVLADRYAMAVDELGLQPVLFPMAEAEDIPCLLPMVDGVLLVVHGGRSSRHIVRRSRQLLQDVGAKIFGVVLNNVSLQSHDYYYYQRYYSKRYYKNDAGEQAAS